MNQYWMIPGDNALHESTSTHGAESQQNPLVKLDPGLFIWTILTFVLLSIILAKFAWKPLLAMLDERNKSIEDSLLSAEKAKAQINVEKNKAMQEIRSEVVNLSIDVAEKIIKKNISKEDNIALIKESLSDIKNYEA